MFNTLILGLVILIFTTIFTYILVADILDVAKRLINISKPYVTLFVNKLS
jgi:hypothetical protein